MFVIDYRINNSRHKLLRTNNDAKQVLVDENYIDEYRITRSMCTQESKLSSRQLNKTKSICLEDLDVWMYVFG